MFPALLVREGLCLSVQNLLAAVGDPRHVGQWHSLDDLLRDDWEWAAEAIRSAYAKVATSLDDLERDLGSGGLIPQKDMRQRAPLLHPSKIVAVGLNYADHCREQGAKFPERPILFAKFPSAIIGPGEPIRLNPELSGQVDFEAELAVIVGRTTSRVDKENALAHVAGYTALNDISARDIQFADRQWVRAKSLDSFCPLGPVLVTSDDIHDPQGLGISCRLNGETMQDSHTGQMIFGVAELISFISQGITLAPGDIIATGTPAGVGAFRTPKVFLKPGDRVSVTIEKIGTLSNPAE
jgi:2-keto-4-pentenoate hydratase/2-oxohepta-3-ene-1,7-dioic acid hydratase in catechol pathway